jgi:hypothetical protein
VGIHIAVVIDVQSKAGGNEFVKAIRRNSDRIGAARLELRRGEVARRIRSSDYANPRAGVRHGDFGVWNDRTGGVSHRINRCKSFFTILTSYV